MTRRACLLLATSLLAGCGDPPYFALEGVDGYPPPHRAPTQVAGGAAAGSGSYAAASPTLVL